MAFVTFDFIQGPGTSSVTTYINVQNWDSIPRPAVSKYILECSHEMSHGSSCSHSDLTAIGFNKEGLYSAPFSGSSSGGGDPSLPEDGVDSAIYINSKVWDYFLINYLPPITQFFGMGFVTVVLVTLVFQMMKR